MYRSMLDVLCAWDDWRYSQEVCGCVCVCVRVCVYGGSRSLLIFTS